MRFPLNMPTAGFPELAPVFRKDLVSAPLDYDKVLNVLSRNVLACQVAEQEVQHDYGVLDLRFMTLLSRADNRRTGSLHVQTE